MSPLNLPPRTRAILKFQRSENGIADDDLDLIDFENLLLTGLSRRNGDDGDDGGMKFTYNFGPGKTNEEEQEEEEGEEGEEIEEADDELSSEGDKNSRNALTPLPIQQQNPSLTAAEITEQQGTALIEAPTAAVAADSSSSSFLGGSTTTTYMGIQPKKGSPSYRRIPLIPAATTTKRRGRNYPRSPQQPYSVLPNAPAVPNQSNYLATPKWSNLTTKGSHDYPLPECYTNRDSQFFGCGKHN
jgi:hypothetical protein